MSEELNTPEAVPSASDVSAEEGGGAEASVSLQQIKDVLGKDFKDADTALKSIKDTYNFVGSQAQYKEKISDIASKLGTDEDGVLSALESLTAQPKAQPKTPQAPTGDYVSREQYEQDQFFARNQELESLKDVLVPLKEAHKDLSWGEFIKQDTVSQLVDTYKTASELQSKKSVVESNPRIAQMTDNYQKAAQALNESRQAARTGDIAAANRAEEAARQSAVNAVIEGLIK